MSLRQESREFAGAQFTTVTLPALRGLALFARLGQADAAVPFLALLKREDSRPFAVALSRVPADDAQSLVREILSATTVVHNGRMESLGTDEALNRVFTGKVLTMVEVCWWVVGVNFADFFEVGERLPSGSPDSESEPPTPPAESPSTSIPTRRRARLRGGSSTPAE